ncbi:MAG TPA: enoyl-CoA hydratase/isomerase family protein [Candidatus Sulfotelmatobacter sp.]|nr:enoyl-CoA hydratase/isomerase family protein [Candidatus Sulfotelmatobacter sp.]
MSSPGNFSRTGQAMSWRCNDGLIELKLHRTPCNEIGSLSLDELESFCADLTTLTQSAHALIIYSHLPCGFCAGADLRELYERSQSMVKEEAAKGIRNFLERIHAVLNTIDESPLTTIAAVNGVVFGGGFELALTCDLIIADKSARFAFPELRLGLIPGFGGIPRLKRDIGNAAVRDLLLTGRSFNATKAQQIGLVSQVVSEEEALRAARATAAQIVKFDRTTSAVAKRFIKPIPSEELRQEIEIFCDLFSRPAVQQGLKKFVESKDAQPYLP